MVLDERGRYDVHFLDNFNGDRMADHLLSEKAATSWHCFDSRMIGRLANLLSLEEKLRCRTLGAWQHNQVRERKGQQPIRSSCRVCLMILSSVLCATRRPSSESAEDGCIMKIYFSQRHVNGGHDDLMSAHTYTSASMRRHTSTTKIGTPLRSRAAPTVSSGGKHGEHGAGPAAPSASAAAASTAPPRLVVAAAAAVAAAVAAAAAAAAGRRAAPRAARREPKSIEHVEELAGRLGDARNTHQTKAEPAHQAQSGPKRAE